MGAPVSGQRPHGITPPGPSPVRVRARAHLLDPPTQLFGRAGLAGAPARHAQAGELAVRAALAASTLKATEMAARWPLTKRSKKAADDAQMRDGGVYRHRRHGGR